MTISPKLDDQISKIKEISELFDKNPIFIGDVSDYLLNQSKIPANIVSNIEFIVSKEDACDLECLYSPIKLNREQNKQKFHIDNYTFSYDISYQSTSNLQWNISKDKSNIIQGIRVLDKSYFNSSISTILLNKTNSNLFNRRVLPSVTSLFKKVHHRIEKPDYNANINFVSERWLKRYLDKYPAIETNTKEICIKAGINYFVSFYQPTTVYLDNHTGRIYKSKTDGNLVIGTKAMKDDLEILATLFYVFREYDIVESVMVSSPFYITFNEQQFRDAHHRGVLQRVSVKEVNGRKMYYQYQPHGAKKDKIMVYHIDLPQYKQSQFMTKLEYKELLELEKHIKNA
jgi:hypothetical protein